jgi:hypothetical protein
VIALVVALVGLPFPGLARLAAPAPTVLSPGAVLELAPPRALPCRRFRTVELNVEAPPDSAYASDPAAVTWRAGGRDWRVGTGIWHPPPAPLEARAFPRRAQLVAEGELTSVYLTFFCQRYETTEHDMLLHDAEPFLGVRWSCTPAGCVTEVGYPLPAAVGRSSRRLRLCAEAAPGTYDVSECDAHHRDISPAFGNQKRALALADEIRADALRTLADACQGAHGCGPPAADVRRALRPERREVTEFRQQPNDLTLEASGTDRLTLHCSAHQDGGNVICNLQLHGPDGRLLVDYLPINDRLMPEAYLEAPGAGLVLISAPFPEEGEDSSPGCHVAGGLLPSAP